MVRGSSSLLGRTGKGPLDLGGAFSFEDGKLPATSRVGLGGWKPLLAGVLAPRVPPSQVRLRSMRPWPFSLANPRPKLRRAALRPVGDALSSRGPRHAGHKRRRPRTRSCRRRCGVCGERHTVVPSSCQYDRLAATSALTSKALGMDHPHKRTCPADRSRQSAENALAGTPPHARQLAAAEWWPRCPEDNRQRLLEIIGYRIKGPDFIQTLVLLTPEDNGMCQAPFAEYHDRVEVRAIACCESELGYGLIEDQATTAWPSNVLLDAPLGDRVVVDIDSGHPLRRFTLGRPNGYPGSVSLWIPVVGEVAWLPVDEL